MFANARISSLGYLCGKNFFPTPLPQESHFGLGWVLEIIFLATLLLLFFFHLTNKKNKINYQRGNLKLAMIARECEKKKAETACGISKHKDTITPLKT